MDPSLSLKAMPRATFRTIGFLAAAVTLVVVLTGQIAHRAVASSEDRASSENKAAPLRSSYPFPQTGGSLRFIQDRSRAGSGPGFYAEGPAGTSYFSTEGLFLGVVVPVTNPGSQDNTISAAPLRVIFEGASPAARLSGMGEPVGLASRYLGGDKDSWESGLPVFSKIRYSSLYPGIDLVYRGTDLASRGGLGLKGYYEVSSGGDPAAIRWRYSGNWSVDAADNGDLRLNLRAADSGSRELELVEKAPSAWQIGGSGEQVPVEVSYLVHEDGSIGFSLGDYDQRKVLIIDPELDYSTFVGGSGTDEGFDVALDSARNAVVVGTTISVDYPADIALDELLVGNRNVLLTKINSDGGGLEFSIFLGGTGDDVGRSISIDSTGEIYLTGTTDSPDFPSTFPPLAPEESGQNIFTVKLSLNGGQLRYSRVFGGSLLDEARGISADDTGAAYIVGVTDSPDFPTFDPFQPVFGGGDTDGFVMKLSPIGDAQVYSSYVGGTGTDEANGIAVDRRGAAYITGMTMSEDFPTQAADGAGVLQVFQSRISDAFLVKLVPDGGGFHFSTYLGQGEGNSGNDIALDRDGNAYVVGTVDSLESAEVAGSTDVFVTAVEAEGKSILFNATFGGSGDEEGLGIGVDRQRNVYASGETESENLATSGLIQPGYGGNGDAFISQFTPEGSLVTTHYLGGGEFDSGRAIAVAGNGDAFVAGVTFSADFPTANAYQSAYRGDGDVYILKIGEVEFIPTPPPTDTPPPPTAPPPPTPTPTAVQNFVLSNTFLYLLLGTTAVVFFLIILDQVIGWIRRRRRRKQDKLF
ncbi:MAG TPA: SBBP repeat-containing protein [Anaerolineales bacterium]|nr:SBBP repeat-containing protein [Anaerolineales bacterium]